MHQCYLNEGIVEQFKQYGDDLQNDTQRKVLSLIRTLRKTTNFVLLFYAKGFQYFIYMTFEK